jgi:hypothetical protein
LWLIRSPRLHRALWPVTRVVNEEFALSTGSSDNDLATLGASLLDDGTQGWAHRDHILLVLGVVMRLPIDQLEDIIGLVGGPTHQLPLESCLLLLSDGRKVVRGGHGDNRLLPRGYCLLSNHLGSA